MQLTLCICDLSLAVLFSSFISNLLCSNDLSQGVRSSAAAVTAAEQGIRHGAQYLNLAVKEGVIPSVKSKVPAAKGTQSKLCSRCSCWLHVIWTGCESTVSACVAALYPASAAEASSVIHFVNAQQSQSKAAFHKDCSVCVLHCAIHQPKFKPFTAERGFMNVQCLVTVEGT